MRELGRLLRMMLTVGMSFELASARAQSAPVNLVDNPSFETARPGDASRPLGWSVGNWGTHVATFTYAREGASGARSGTVEITAYTSGDAKWVFDEVAVTSGTRYVYGDTFRSNVSSAWVAAYRRADATMAYETLKTLPASADWTRATVAFSVPAGVRSLSVYHLISAVGRLQVDDVSVSPPSAADLSSGVPNGDLEQLSDGDAGAPLAWRPSWWGVLTPTFRYANVGRGGSRGVRLTVADHASGDAKWVFDAQPVTPGTSYFYRDVYTSDTDSGLVAEVRSRDGSVRYLNMGSVPASPSFVAAEGVFVAPPQAVSATVFHLLRKNGTLTIDDASLAALPPVALVDGVPNGDLEQPAYPGAPTPAAWMRNAYGTHDAAFSYPMEGHGGARSLRVDIGSYTSGRAGWFFEPQPVRAEDTYRFRDFYRSNVDTTVTAQVWLADGSDVEQQLPAAFASSGWTPYVADVSVPAGATRLTVHHQLGRTGYLQTDDHSLQPTGSAPFRRALVSFTFDDGWRTDHDSVLPIFRSHGAVATHYVITGFFGQPGRLTAAMAADLAAQGHEIGSHTVSHPDLTTLSASALRPELTASKSTLEALGVGPVSAFASPFGAYNAVTLAAIRGRYRSHRTTDVGYNRRALFGIDALKVQNIRSTTTVAEVDAWAAQAAATRSWLILVYHDVVDPPDSIYGTTPASLDAHLSVVQNLGLPILTVTQALDELVPQL